MTTPSYSEVPFSENAEAAGQAPSVAPVARALVIPSAPLAIPDQAAVTELDRRIQMGNSFQRSRLFRSAAATRNVLRWHEENAGIIEGMFQDDNRDAERPLGDLIYPSGIWKMLDSEIARLSSLRERIAVRMGRALPGASSGDSGSGLPSADAGISVGAPPGRDSGSAPAPDLPPLTAPDEPPEVPARPLDPAAYRSIAIAAAASAALPAYDADAASSRDFIGIDAVADAFSYLLASRNAQPPLAIGLFGEWGSGKSFLMQSIRRRVDEITRGARQSPGSPLFRRANSASINVSSRSNSTPGIMSKVISGPALERDAGEVDLNPASLQLDDDEVRFLGELLPILDSSPRGLKRYINIYRLIKTVLGEPSPSSSGQAQRRMFLLAVLTSFPSGSDIITYVIDSPSPATQTLGDRISEFLDQRGIDEYGLAGSVTLRNWLAEQSFIASRTIAETLDDARHVRLYSFS